MDHGDEVILPVPYWVSFKDIIQYAGGKVVYLPTDEAENFRITADAIEQTLAFWMRELSFDYRIQMAPYNQVFQLLLDHAGALAANRGGVNAVLVRFEDWARVERSAEPDLARLEADVRHFVEGLRAAA